MFGFILTPLMSLAVNIHCIQTFDCPAFSLKKCENYINQKICIRPNDISKILKPDEFPYFGTTEKDQAIFEVRSIQRDFYGIPARQIFLAINKDSVVTSVFVELPPDSKSDSVIQAQYGSPTFSSGPEEGLNGFRMKAWNKKTYDITTTINTFYGEYVQKMIVQFSNMDI